MPSYIKIRLKFSELWSPKFGFQCKFFQFLEDVFTLNFCRDHKFETQDLKSILRHTRINYQHHIWSSSGLSTERSFSSFGQYCLNLRAIISIINRDNRPLDGCFGKLKRLPISMSSIFDSNALF